MFICTYAFVYHMYQSKGELHANVKLHFCWNPWTMPQTKKHPLSPCECGLAYAPLLDWTAVAGDKFRQCFTLFRSEEVWVFYVKSGRMRVRCFSWPPSEALFRYLTQWLTSGFEGFWGVLDPCRNWARTSLEVFGGLLREYNFTITQT